MARINLEGNPAVSVDVRHSARARRMSLRVSSIDGRVTLTVPAGISHRRALEFVREKSSWISSVLEGQGQPVPVGQGAMVPVEGRNRLVVGGTGRRARLGAEEIMAPPGREGPAILAFLKELARTRLLAEVDRFSSEIGRNPGRLTLRDPRSRWGSCTTEGNLMFSWRLILAPPVVLSYVAAHEVAHLERMDHSPAFWELVERIFPRHRGPRDWLRREGASLHRYRFRSAGN